MADYIVFEGKAKWAKVFEDNRDLEGFEGSAKEHGGQYTVDLVLNEENEKKLTSSGSRLSPKLDTDGDMIVKFKRKHIAPFEAAGGPPKVYHADGKPWDFVKDGAIGNLSELKVKACVYPSKYGKGTRLESIVVTTLVSFDEGGTKDWDADMFSDVSPAMAEEVPF